MAHDTAYLTISREEASRIDDQAKRRLLASRKLSLVVDLDCTIIHAAVDPTIKQWMDDKDDPNHAAVSDVRMFQLTDDGPGMRGCWYYIKLRPGLADFLEHVSQLYELHIYTMGTRQYAKEIAKLVDPDGKYFNDRILSRDESGSASVKSLERLFPVDTRMVVIMDDRADVWHWSANLIRVSVFDFFVGIGDINSSFLPKKQEINEAPKPEPKQLVANGQENGANGEEKPIQTAEDGTSTIQNGTAPLEQLIAMSGGDSPEVRELQTKDQEEVINSQLEDKPLLKMQLQQDQKDEAEAAANGDAPASQPTDSDSSDASESSDSNSAYKQKPRHSILRTDDEELIHLEGALTKVHEAFFTEYDRKRVGGKGGRVAELTGKRKAPLPSRDDDDGQSLDLLVVPDIKKVMPAVKMRVLSGVTIVFSGIIPLVADIQTADITTWAKTFGATITDKVTRDVTHVIAAELGTTKAKQALKRGIKVVGKPWLLACIQQWRKLDERPYLLDKNQKHRQETSTDLGDNIDKSGANANDFLLSSSDGETTGLDTEDDQPARKKLKLDTVNNEGPATYDNVVDDGSPVTINQDEWADIDAELKEFLGSDAESESDTDSVSSKLSIREARAGKRRREDDGGDDDLSNRSPARKRHGKGSTLKAVNNIDSESAANDTSTAGGTDQQVTPAQKMVKDVRKRTEAEEEEDDDELARELERELEDYNGGDD